MTNGPSASQKPMSSGGTDKRKKEKAEGKSSLRAGEEITEVSPTPKPRSTASRAKVKADAKAAAKAGEIPMGEAGITKTQKP